MSKRAAALVMVITAGGALLLWLSPGPARPPEAPPVPTQEPAAQSAPPAPVAAAIAAPAPTAPVAAPVDRKRELLLPDGSYVPALNGAEDAAPIATYWGPFPWSPIIGIETNSQGLDWYKHKDGSYSTTQMVWREDLGRKVAMTRVAHPAPGETPKVAPAVAPAASDK